MQKAVFAAVKADQFSLPALVSSLTGISKATIYRRAPDIAERARAELSADRKAVQEKIDAGGVPIRAELAELYGELQRLRAFATNEDGSIRNWLAFSRRIELGLRVLALDVRLRPAQSDEGAILGFLSAVLGEREHIEPEAFTRIDAAAHEMLSQLLRPQV